MQQFMMISILALTTFEYLVKVDALPHVVKYFPELISSVVMVYVIVTGVRNRFRFVRPAYWVAFGAMAIVMICGALSNGVEPGPLFAGIRAYLRPIPLFFLPAVYLFSEQQVRRQLRLLLVVCLAQVPLALDQRFATVARGGVTGDETSGTFLQSGVLSVFLICAACVLTAAFVRKRIGLVKFLPLVLLILIPTTVNETKATLFLLPFGLLVTFILGSPPVARLKNGVLAIAVLVMFGAIFIPTYDYFNSSRKYGTPITEFFTKEGKFDKYMNKDAGVGAQKAGRVDAIVTPLREMSRDPAHFAFGVGLGNASESSLGLQFTGRYFKVFGPFLLSAASLFILELGLFGMFIVMIFFHLVYRDSRAVANGDDGLMGSFAVGYTGVVAVMAVATFYVDFVASAALAYLFWYFAGLISSYRMGAASEGRGRTGVGSA